MSADMIDDYIASVGAALGLPIEDAWKGAVRANLEVSLRMARLVDEFPLPDETEPAEIYEASLSVLPQVGESEIAAAVSSAPASALRRLSMRHSRASRRSTRRCKPLRT